MKLNLNIDDFLKILIINLSVILVIPFNLILINKNFIPQLFDSSVLFSFIIFFFIFLFASLIIFIFLNNITIIINRYLNRIFLFLLSFIFFWIIINGIFVPAVGEHDPFLNLKYSLKLRYILVLKIIFVLSFLYFVRKYKKEFLFIKFSLIYIFFNLIYIFVSIFFFIDQESNIKPKINLFGKKNLIVLSLDGISGYKLNDEIKMNPSFKNILKDFKFYKNVTTSWPATIHSLNVELNEKILDRNHKNLKNNILNDQNINTIVYGNYKKFIINKKNIVERGRYEKYGRAYNTHVFFQSIFTGSLGRWGTPIIVSYAKNIFYTKFYKNFISIISFDFLNENFFSSEKIHTAYYVQKKEFDTIFQNTKFDDNLENVIRMYHFSFSHWPVKINEKCEEVKRLDIKRIYHEKIAIKCLVTKIELFLDALKKNNIYNNSLVVIKSDHGKPNNHYEEYPYNLKINDSVYWGLGRYKTFIMIKNDNQIQKEINISNNHVFIADLAITYCNFFYDQETCNTRYKYNNLLLSEKSFKKNSYEIYIPKKKYTFIDLNDFSKHEITNDMTLKQNLENIGVSLD